MHIGGREGRNMRKLRPAQAQKTAADRGGTCESPALRRRRKLQPAGTAGGADG